MFIEQHRKHHIQEGMDYFTNFLTKFYKVLNDWIKLILIDLDKKQHSLSKNIYE